MFAHYYTSWMLLDAGPILDPYMPFFLFFSLDPNTVTAVLLLLFSCSSAEDFFIFLKVTSIFTLTIPTI